MNWSIVWLWWFRRRRASSWIPLLGGGLAAIGLLTLPLSKPPWLWCTPLLLDFGCAIGLGYTAIWHIRRVLGSRGSTGA
jgi:hypothetical protein